MGPSLSMQIAIIGAGIVGVTTAYELALQGHTVSVFERHSSVAVEASFAHAGLLGAGHFLLPATGPRRWRHLGAHADALDMVGAAALRHAPWLWRRWRAGRPAQQIKHRLAMQNLALFSRDRMLGLTRTLQLDYEQSPGLLLLLRTAREAAAARAELKALKANGQMFELLDRARCQQVEPALHTDTPLYAGVFWPHDGVGNCRHFAQLLKAQAQAIGVQFYFDTPVHALTPGARPTLQTVGADAHSFDAIVVCAGARANQLLQPLGLGLPLVSVSGYTLTAPLRSLDGQPDLAPRAAVIDLAHGVTITRLGQRVRVSGGAELGGYAGRMAPQALQRLYRVLDDWFPGAALTRQALHWKGSRPMLPDGPPVLGASGAPGVWLNLGHGGNGWAMACGSARVIAELLAGRPAPLDVSGMGAARFR
jgi:D-amino-acid dehydrogenase